MTKHCRVSTQEKTQVEQRSLRHSLTVCSRQIDEIRTTRGQHRTSRAGRVEARGAGGGIKREEERWTSLKNVDLVMKWIPAAAATVAANKER